MHSYRIQHRDRTWRSCAGVQPVSHSKHYRTWVALSCLVCCPHVLCRWLKDVVSSCSIEQTAAITEVSRSQIYLVAAGPHGASSKLDGKHGVLHRHVNVKFEREKSEHQCKTFTVLQCVRFVKIKMCWFTYCWTIVCLFTFIYLYGVLGVLT